MPQSNKSPNKKVVSKPTKPLEKKEGRILTRNINKENEKTNKDDSTKKQYEKILPDMVEDTDNESSSSDDEGSSPDSNTNENISNVDSTVDITTNKKLSEEIDKQVTTDNNNIENDVKESTSNKVDYDTEEVTRADTNPKPGEITVDTTRQSRRLNIKVSHYNIFFNTRNKKYSFMSNFYPSKLLIDGKEYWHVEGYYQSQKFAGVNKAAEEHIRTALSPLLCKKVAYSYPFPPSRRKEWDDGLRDKVMKKGVLCKFITDKYLAESLISTDDTTLIEDNIYDEYWANGTGGRGLNKLGNILMSVRDILTQMN